MLIEILMLIASILIVICGFYTHQQFKCDYSSDCEKIVADSMAARSNKVVLDLADAYQLPDELGMKKVEAIEVCKKAVLQYESDYFIAVEELEMQPQHDANITYLRARS